MPIIWYSAYVYYMVEDRCQTMTPYPASLIISTIIPEGPTVLPEFILLTGLDTISDVILIAGPSTGASSLIFAVTKNLILLIESYCFRI